MTVSAFEHAEATDPHPVTLADWLQSTRQPRTRAELRRAEIIQAIRNHPEINDPDSKAVAALKKTLPGITPGAVCSGGRKKEKITTITGFMQFDIDIKENPQLPTGAALREAVSNIKNVFYAGLSTRGAGVYGLVKVSDPDNWPLHFQQLVKDFDLFGIVLDKKPKNPHSLRFYSYDPEAYINPAALLYNRKAPPIVNADAGEKTAAKPRPIRTYSTAPKFTDEYRIDVLTRKIVEAKKDITTLNDPLYDWLAIAYGIAAVKGEAGRDNFHDISQFYTGYDEAECNRVYTSCMGKAGSIAPFFSLCRQAGFNFMDEPEKKLSELPVEARTQTKPNGNTPDYPPDWDEIQLHPDSTEYREAEYYLLTDV